MTVLDRRAEPAGPELVVRPPSPVITGFGSAVPGEMVPLNGAWIVGRAAIEPVGVPEHGALGRLDEPRRPADPAEGPDRAVDAARRRSSAASR